MEPPGAALVFLSLAAGGTAVALGAYAGRNRGEPGAASFTWLMAGSALWSFSYAVSLFAFDPEIRVLFEIPIEIAQAIVAPAWLFFALGYTGRGELVTRRVVVASLLFPAATLLAVVTNQSHHLLWENYRVAGTWGVATVAFDPNLWFFVHAAYGYALVGTGLVLIFEMFVSHPRLYREQALALGVGSAVPTAAHVAATFDLGPYPTVNFTPVGLGVLGLTYAYALYRFELLGLAPATYRLGRRAAIDDVGVALVIVGTDGRVVELNDTAEETFGVDEADARGLELAALTGEPYEPEDGARLERSVDGERRTFESTVSVIADQHGRQLGRTIALTDVTERDRRRQLLEVQNRVLRHNLRNGMTVVLGNAEVVAERADGEIAEAMEGILDRGRDLLEVADKARVIERIVESDDDPERLDLAELVADVAGEVREEFPTARIEVEVESAPTPVRTREFLLRVIVRNLIENAAEHGRREGTDADITVRAGREGETPFVSVADAGPGIPDTELRAIRAGTETALEHGSGLGLWLVRWGADRLGGDVAFETPAEGGTVATLRLPPDGNDDGDDAATDGDASTTND